MSKIESNQLFRAGPNADLNACVGDNGGPYDFSDYGEGFFEGAKKIVDAIKSGEWAIDILIYPAAFSFRHGIELYVKYLIAELSKYNKSAAEYKKNHLLTENWNILVAEAQKSKLSMFKDAELDSAGKIITEFCQIDPTGQVFRYPEDIKGNPHLKNISVINVEVLETGMNELHAMLEKWRGGFDSLRDNVGA
ncbi:MAG TPA: hypothetical protein VKT73_04555 [Xanthobacteraceae bacterium]|nr:hypothetical protein [Xanthobacteraceae bacterium]